MYLCVLYHSHNKQCLIPLALIAMGIQRVSASPDEICTGQGDTGTALQNFISFVYLRRYISLATEAIVK